MPRKSSSTRDVFLNFPFDVRYRNLYLALIAGTTALGMKPRCVLEIETTTDRLNRLLKLISSCQYSIHDLSRVQLDAAAPRCPRFNMPFELGLTLARTGKLDPNHHWIVLEERPYRIQKSMSDLNGYDPYIHNGTVTGLLQVLKNAFHNPVSVADMKTAYTLLQLSAKGLKSENDCPDLYGAEAFRQLALMANKISGELRSLVNLDGL